MKTAFTPGPWRWEEPDYGKEHNPPENCASWGLTGADDTVLAGCDNCANIFYNQADGHLIAAAPEMYEALFELWQCHVHATRDDYARAFLALAKARGEV